MFTTQGETLMSIRIQNSAKQVMKTSKATASITRGRSNMLLIGNKVIIAQKNGNETRSHAADTTLREFADSIYAMLKAKGYRKPRAKETKPRAKRLNLAQRLAEMEATKNRKLGLTA